ncbi:MAG: hypothetical protein ACKVZJ_09860 [Phycisphaerales bacterium]
MQVEPSIDPASESTIKCVFTRYATSTRAARMLVHGVAVQIVAAIMSYSGAYFATPEMRPDLPTLWERVFSAGSLLMLLGKILSLAGWAMVIFACGKVVAEAVKEPSA